MISEDKYLFFSEEEFLWDLPFRNWVLQPNEDSDIFWNEWMKEHPERISIVRNAMVKIRALQPKEPELTEGEITEEIKKIMHALPSHRELALSENKTGVHYFLSKFRKWAMIAAALLGVLLGLFWIQHTFINEQSSSRFPSYSELVKKVPLPLTEWHNQTSEPMEIILQDGSVVLLEPGGKLGATATFEGLPFREVFLSGKAFFNVKQKVSQPFHVFANGVITKVLGTSFTVSADDNSGRVRVQVRTGKVQVIEQNANLSKKDIKGVVLTANQQVEFDPNEENMSIQLADNPLPVPREDLLGKKIYPPTRFSYNQALLSEVFNDVEHTYGIAITAENQAILNCRFSGDISTSSLYEQLSMICIAINASYHVNGTTVLVSGKGCE